MKKIAVILPNNLGDVIMALPVLDGLKKKNSECHITFFVEDGYEGGLEQNPNCDVIYRFERKKIHDAARGPDWKSGLSLLKDTIDELRNSKFDQIINLAQHPYLSYIVALTGVSDVKGARMLPEGNLSLQDKWSQYLYTIPFAREFNRLHATDIYKNIADIKGTSVSRIVLVKQETDFIETYMKSKNVPDVKYVCFQPGAAYQAKRWPVENFVALGKSLVQDGFYILITGAQAEREIADGIKAQLQDDCTVTSGELTFRQTIALVSKCEFCVTGDTALMHAASSLQKKVYAFFGSTSPVETGPYGDDNIVFAGRCPRRPCFCGECKTKLCMKSILPEIVYDVICGTAKGPYNCDIYKTKISSDGFYMLQPVYGTDSSYYSKVGSLMTLSVFNEIALPAIEETDELQVYKAQTMQFVQLLQQMENELNCFLVDNKPESVSKFEQIKTEISTIKGIGEFWAALLNIRLNSVPLIDIRAGIQMSRDICRVTRQQVAAIL